MKRQDLGFNPETGQHDPAFTEAEAAIMGILADHIGEEHFISAKELTTRFYVSQGWDISLSTKKDFDQAKRDIRYLTNHLVIDHEQAIISKAGYGGGYCIAGNKQEVDKFYETFRRRALTGLTKAARGKKAVMVSIVKQLAFEFEELKTRERPALVKPYGYESAPVAVVTAFLDKMTREPEKFDNEIRLLRDKFGKVLMPKEEFCRIQTLSRELQAALEKVA